MKFDDFIKKGPALSRKEAQKKTLKKIYREASSRTKKFP